MITGTLLDEHGEAIPNTPVRALRYVTQNGLRTLQSSGNAQTDDRGIYRLFGLQPGEYLVSATPRNNSREFVAVQQREAVQSALERARTVAATNPEQAQVLAERIERLSIEVPAGEDGPMSGYAPVYYPGTTNPASAVTVAVGASEEKSGVDFQSVVVPVSRVEGVVTAGSGTLPANVQLTLVNAGFDVPGLSPGNTRADQQGAFRFANVPPGQYTIFARSTIVAGREGGPGGRGFAPGRGGAAPGGRGEPQVARGRINGPDADPIRMWGTADVAVDGRSQANVVITLQPGVPVSGRIVFDGASAQPAALTSMRVSLAPIPSGEREIASGATGRVDAEGRFTISSVIPGRYRLGASGAGPGWVVASSMLDGQDAFDFPVEVRRRDRRRDGHAHRSSIRTVGPDHQLAVAARARLHPDPLSRASSATGSRSLDASSRCGPRPTAAIPSATSPPATTGWCRCSTLSPVSFTTPRFFSSSTAARSV